MVEDVPVHGIRCSQFSEIPVVEKEHITSGRSHATDKLHVFEHLTHFIVLNTTMRIVSGCLKTTPTFYLPVVSGIIPPDIRRSNISLKLFNKANSDPTHLLHNACTRGSTIKPRLTSRTPFSKQCVLVNSSDNTDNPRTWPMNTWNSRWANLSTSTSPLHLLAFNEPNRPRPSHTLLGPS